MAHGLSHTQLFVLSYAYKDFQKTAVFHECVVKCCRQEIYFQRTLGVIYNKQQCFYWCNFSNFCSDFYRNIANDTKTLFARIFLGAINVNACLVTMETLLTAKI